MQSWKFNSTAQGILREAISKSLKIPYNDVYKTIRETKSNFIRTKDGCIYEIILKQII